MARPDVTALLRDEAAKLEKRLARIKAALKALGQRATHPGERSAWRRRVDPGDSDGRGKRKRKRNISAAGRKAISEAQKARWAKVKVGQKK